MSEEWAEINRELVEDLQRRMFGAMPMEGDITPEELLVTFGEMTSTVIAFIAESGFSDRAQMLQIMFEILAARLGLKEFMSGNIMVGEVA